MKHYPRYNDENDIDSATDAKYLLHQRYRGQIYQFNNSQKKEYLSKQPQLSEYTKYRNKDPYKAQLTNDKYDSLKGYQSKDHLKLQKSKQMQNTNKYINKDSNRSQQQHLKAINVRQINARKQQLQMKMNNINTISDKITNLLSFVNRDNSHNSSKEKQLQRTPIINKAVVHERQKTPEANQKLLFTPPKNQRVQPDISKENNKSLKRLRTLSLLSPNLGSQQEKDLYQAQLNQQVQNIVQQSSKKAMKNSNKVNKLSIDKYNHEQEKSLNRNTSKAFSFYNKKEMIVNRKRQQVQLSPFRHNILNSEKQQSDQNQGNDITPITLISKETKDMRSNKFELKVIPVINDRNQTIKIAIRLHEQIQLDNNLKKGIVSFNYNSSQDKWQTLHQKINQIGIKLTLSQIKYLLNFPQKPSNQAYQQGSKKRRWSFIQQFSETQRFWENEVKGCASLRLLKKEGFNPNQLDQQSKGFLSIQDVSEFIRKYTGHSHSDGQLLLVFKRLQLQQGNKNQTNIRALTFLQVFST